MDPALAAGLWKVLPVNGSFSKEYGIAMQGIRRDGLVDKPAGSVVHNLVTSALAGIAAAVFCFQLFAFSDKPSWSRALLTLALIAYIGGRIRAHLSGERRALALLDIPRLAVLLYFGSLSNAMLHSLRGAELSSVFFVRILVVVGFALLAPPRNTLARGFAVLGLSCALPFSAGMYGYVGWGLPASVLVLAGLLLALANENRKRTPVSSQTRWILAFLFAWALLFTGLLFLSRDPADSIQRLPYLYAALAGATALAIHEQTQELFDAIVRSITFSGTLVVLFSILMFGLDALGLPGWAPGKEMRLNLISTHFGLGLLSTASAALLLDHRRRWRIAAALFVYILVVLTLMLIMARASLLGLLVGGVPILVAALLQGKRVSRRGILIYGLFAACGFILVGATLALVGSSSLEEHVPSLYERFNLWTIALNIARLYWLTGVGSFQQFKLSTQSLADGSPEGVLATIQATDPWTEPHSLYISLLLGGGVLALILFAGLVVAVFRSILSLAPADANEEERWNAATMSVPFLSLLVAGVAESITSTATSHLALLIFIVLAIGRVESSPRLQPGAAAAPAAKSLLKPGLLQAFACFALLAGCWLLVSWYFQFRAINAATSLIDRVRDIAIVESIPTTANRGAPVNAQRCMGATEQTLNRLYSSTGDLLTPYSFLPPQLNGERYLCLAIREPSEREKFVDLAIDEYERAIRRNKDMPLLYLRQAEALQYRASFSVPQEARRYRAAAERAMQLFQKLDPYDRYAGVR